MMVTRGGITTNDNQNNQNVMNKKELVKIFFSFQKFHIMIMLKSKKLWQIINGVDKKDDVENKNEWDIRDVNACMYITQAINKNHFQQLVNFTTFVQHLHRCELR